MEPLASGGRTNRWQSRRLLTGPLRPGCASSEAATFFLTFLHFHQHESSSSWRNSKTVTLFLTSSYTGFLPQGCLILSYLCWVFPFKGFALAVPTPPSTTVPMPSRHTDSKRSSTQRGKERVWATYCIFSCTLCPTVGRPGLSHTFSRVTDPT